MSARSLTRLLLLVAIGAGCREVVGIDDHAKFEGQTNTCGFTATTGECTQCVRGSCCSEAATCSADPTCNAFATCIAGCAPGASACASDCRARFGAGFGPAALALESCKARSCAAECGQVCGGYVYPNIGDGGAIGSCATCATTKCCDTATSCMRDPECAAIAGCQAACAYDDEGCHLRCEADHRVAAPLHRAFGECIAKSCLECVAPNWRCLLSVKPRPVRSTGPNINVTLRFTDYLNGRPVADLKVRPCGPTDLSCKTDNYASPAMTDLDGIARVHFWTNFFDGYFEVTGENYGPILIYYPPLTKDFSNGGNPIPDRGTFMALATQVAPPQDGRGSLIVTVRDCGREARAGVQVSVAPSEGTTQFYTSQGLPSTSATSTSGDEYGASGFANVKTGTALIVNATVLENSLSLPTATVQTRSDTFAFTSVWLYANPP